MGFTGVGHGSRSFVYGVTGGEPEWDLLQAVLP